MQNTQNPSVLSFFVMEILEFLLIKILRVKTEIFRFICVMPTVPIHICLHPHMVLYDIYL